MEKGQGFHVMSDFPLLWAVVHEILVPQEILAHGASEVSRCEGTGEPQCRARSIALRILSLGMVERYRPTGGMKSSSRKVGFLR